MRLSPVGPAPMRRRSTSSTRGIGCERGAVGQAQLGRSPRARQELALERGRRAAEHAHAAGAVRAQDRHVARVVADALLLLEARVVLLVDDDEPERGAPVRRARCGRRWRRRPRPARSRRHISCRSRGVRPEWRTATSSPKRARKRATSCGVSAISGTSTIEPRPRSRAAAMARRYTSVLPLPVTPWRRNVRRAASRRARRSRSIAAVCAAVASCGASRAAGSREERVRRRLALAPPSTSPSPRELLDRRARVAPARPRAGDRLGARGPHVREDRRRLPAQRPRLLDARGRRDPLHACALRRRGYGRRASARPARAPSRARRAAARAAPPRRWARSSRRRDRAGTRASPRGPRAARRRSTRWASRLRGGSPSRTASTTPTMRRPPNGHTTRAPATARGREPLGHDVGEGARERDGQRDVGEEHVIAGGGRPPGSPRSPPGARP